MSPMKSLRHVAAVLSSLGLLIGCVLFKQKQANPALMPSSKSLGNLITPSASSRGSQTIMPGSKSYTGSAISSDLLQAIKTPTTLTL